MTTGAHPTRWTRRLSSVRAKLLAVLLPVVALATLISTGGLTMFLEDFFRTRIERDTAVLGDAIRASLQQQMLQRVPELTQRTLEELGNAGEIRRVLILNRAGRVAHAYPPAERGRVIDRDLDPTCRDCHAEEATARRPSELVRDAVGRPLLRVALRIENEPRCQGCHGTASRLNGMLLIERDAGAAAAAVGTIRVWMGTTWAVTLAVLGALIVGTTTMLVHRPVARLIDAARRIGRGELDTRVTVDGRGEIAELGATLNAMSANLEASLEESREKSVELSVLYSIVDRLSRTVFVAELKPLVLDVVAEALRAPRVTLVCPAMDGCGYELHRRTGTTGVTSVTAQVDTLDASELGVSTALLRAWIHGRLGDTFVDEAEPVAALPLRFADRDLGLLLVAPPVDERFDADDLRLIGALRAHIAVALDNARLYTLAITDELTQLSSLRHFELSLADAVRRFARYGEPVALLMVDLDRFKAVNDTHGHLAGNVVLKEVARRIRASVRETDLPCRYGGEEFAVILPHTDGAGARVIAERVRRAVAAQPVSVDDAVGCSIRVTVSVGVAWCPAHAPTAARLVGVADAALYEAKQAGRNRVCVAGTPRAIGAAADAAG